MGLEEEKFWSSTLRQVFWKMDGHRIAKEHEWERTRYIAAILINSNSKRKVTPQQLVPLSIDENNKRQITAEEKELIRKNWLNGRNGRLGKS